jgi:Inner membrane component of T3SS, cytoplasmic domain/zinc-ribbon domain
MQCARCGQSAPDDARYCPACGAPILDDDSTVTLSVVEAADLEDDLAAYLEGLPPGVGMLVVRHGPNAGSTYRLDDPVTTAGRAPDSQIFLDDITVSRAHVAIRHDPEGYTISDAGSLNGTYVNRERVETAHLSHGDEIQIGRFRLTFVRAEAESSA